VRLAGWAAAAVLLVPAAAGAHPLDEVVQGSYLTLAPGQVRLELDISPGPIVADGVLRLLDANGDRTVTADEARAFGQAVLRSSTLTLDGKPATWRLERVAAPTYDNVRLGADTIKIYAVAARTDRAGPHLLTFDNRYAPAKSQAAANIFLTPGLWRYAVTAQAHGPDGRSLTVRYTASR
jgi:hypothetical protein